MVGVTDRALDEKIAIAVPVRCLAIALLMYKWDKEITQSMHRQHRHIKISLNQREPAHPIITNRVNTSIRLETAHFRLKHPFPDVRSTTVSPAIDTMGIIIDLSGQNSCHCAVRATGSQYRALPGRVAKAFLENRPFTTGQVHSNGFKKLSGLVFRDIGRSVFIRLKEVGHHLVNVLLIVFVWPPTKTRQLSCNTIIVTQPLELILLGLAHWQCTCVSNRIPGCPDSFTFNCRRSCMPTH